MKDREVRHYCDTMAADTAAEKKAAKERKAAATTEQTAKGPSYPKSSLVQFIEEIFRRSN